MPVGVRVPPPAPPPFSACPWQDVLHNALRQKKVFPWKAILGRLHLRRVSKLSAYDNNQALRGGDFSIRPSGSVFIKALNTPSMHKRLHCRTERRSLFLLESRNLLFCDSFDAPDFLCLQGHSFLWCRAKSGTRNAISSPVQIRHSLFRSVSACGEFTCARLCGFHQLYIGQIGKYVSQNFDCLRHIVICGAPSQTESDRGFCLLL